MAEAGVRGSGDEEQFEVVVNHEEQYSIWPADDDPPAGWLKAGVCGSKADCLDYIEHVWTDMRPRSLRDGVLQSSPGERQ